MRRLIEQTPAGCGILAAGRAQYFSGPAELLNSLGLKDGEHYILLDFDDEQANQLLGEGAPELPDWVPPRPLLLRFLVDNDLLSPQGAATEDRNSAWHSMMTLVSEREAQRIGSLTPHTIRALIARLATTTKSSSDPNGSISVPDMRLVFREICGYEADEEGLQLLLRLPGLAATTDSEEGRRFIDLDLADASYGLDLALFLQAPYGAHPLAMSISWTAASGDLAAGVASAELQNNGFSASSILGAVSKRLDHGLFDAVLLDTVRTVDTMGLESKTDLTPFFSEVLLRSLDLTGEPTLMASATFSECVIEQVVVDGFSQSAFPKFQNCLIGEIDGWAEVPASRIGNVSGCEISHFEAPAVTTDALVDLDLSSVDRVALVILKKVYLQPGSGRKLAALYRGMPLNDRGEVPGIVSQFVAAGLLARVTGRGRDLVVPVKAFRRAITELLTNPQDFSLTKALDSAGP